MGKIKRERGIYRIENKDGSVSWMIDYLNPDKKRVRLTFSTLKQAREERAKRLGLIADGEYSDFVEKKEKSDKTLKMLIEAYKENYKHQTSFKNAKKTYLENFKQFFGEDTLLTDIRYINLEKYRNHLRQKPTKTIKVGKEIIKGTRKTASINREMSCLHHLFDKAVEWEFFKEGQQSPFKKGKSLILKENNKRLRFLGDKDKGEMTRLLGTCPPYLKDIVECAINTGMRKGEMLSLKWDQIRNGLIYLRKTKTNDARQIPINNSVEAIFNRIRKQHQLKSKYVFTYKGKQIKDGVRTSFKAAMKRAGVVDFQFHDLRHTFASQLLLKGGTLKDIQELLGHKTMTMTLRYAHLTQEHKKKAVNLLNDLTGNSMSVNVSCADFEKTAKVVTN